MRNKGNAMSTIEHARQVAPPAAAAAAHALTTRPALLGAPRTLPRTLIEQVCDIFSQQLNILRSQAYTSFLVAVRAAAAAPGPAGRASRTA